MPVAPPPRGVCDVGGSGCLLQRMAAVEHSEARDRIVLLERSLRQKIFPAGASALERDVSRDRRGARNELRVAGAAPGTRRKMRSRTQ